MGLIEDLARAGVAFEGLKKLDANLGNGSESIAAITSFEGARASSNLSKKKEDQNSNRLN